MLLSQYETWKGDNEGMGQGMDQEDKCNCLGLEPLPSVSVS